MARTPHSKNAALHRQKHHTRPDHTDTPISNSRPWHPMLTPLARRGPFYKTEAEASEHNRPPGL
eukprot:scaffold319903_cov15-Prasinocladus_malaysianus.AAC.1